MAKRKALSQIPRSADAETRGWMESVKEIIDTSEGARGNPLDRKLTVRDLIDSGIGALRGSIAGRFIGGGQLQPGGERINRTVPPRPEQVLVVPVLNAIVISMNHPNRQYGNHAYGEIWRAEGLDATLDTAVRIGTFAGSSYTDYTVGQGEPFTYWVRFVSQADVSGPYHSPVGNSVTSVVSAESLLIELSGQIDESHLSQSLNTRIDDIEFDIGSLFTGQSTLDTKIETETTQRISEDEALATQITTVAATADGNTAAIQTESTARADADTALASEISTVAATASGNTAAIQTESTTRASEDAALAQQITTVQSNLDGEVSSIEQTLTTQGNALDGLSAEYTLKLDVNGYVSGFGTFNDGETSEFQILADRFSVTGPGTVGSIKPFIIDGDNVYINTLFVKEASIDEGLLGPISFGKIVDDEGVPITTVAGKLKADYIDAQNLSVAEAATFSGELASDNFFAGSSGWRLLKSGAAEFRNIIARGNIEATTLNGAGIVNSTHLAELSVNRFTTVVSTSEAAFTATVNTPGATSNSLYRVEGSMLGNASMGSQSSAEITEHFVEVRFLTNGTYTGWSRKLLIIGEKTGQKSWADPYGDPHTFTGVMPANCTQIQARMVFTTNMGGLSMFGSRRITLVAMIR